MNSDSNYDLNLPLVREGEEPLPLGSPTEDAQFAHARFLAAGKSEEFWEERRSRMNPEPFRLDDSLNLPVFDVPQMNPPADPMSWARVMEETRAVREHYMKHHDSPERRLADKNPEHFVL